MTKRAALILAGGKARRFQHESEEWQDKALALLCGKPLLIHVVENAREVVDEIIICVNDETRRTKYTKVMENHNVDNVRLVVDEKISHVSGPNVAILTGLKATKTDFCVTLPCDMPFLKPKIINYLFDAAEDAQVTVPMWPNSRIETLVMVLERPGATAIPLVVFGFLGLRWDTAYPHCSQLPIHPVSPAILPSPWEQNARTHIQRTAAVESSQSSGFSSAW